jgi:hypothetical protein
VGFRTSAVHVSSVLPEAHRSSRTAGLAEVTGRPPANEHRAACGGCASGDVRWAFEGLGRAAG